LQVEEERHFQEAIGAKLWELWGSKTPSKADDQVRCKVLSVTRENGLVTEVCGLFAVLGGRGYFIDLDHLDGLSKHYFSKYGNARSIRSTAPLILPHSLQQQLQLESERAAEEGIAPMESSDSDDEPDRADYMPEHLVNTNTLMHPAHVKGVTQTLQYRKRKNMEVASNKQKGPYPKLIRMERLQRQATVSAVEGTSGWKEAVSGVRAAVEGANGWQVEVPATPSVEHVNKGIQTDGGKDPVAEAIQMSGIQPPE